MTDKVFTSRTCRDCGHEHAGKRWAHICIGCPCETRPAKPTVIPTEPQWSPYAK